MLNKYCSYRPILLVAQLFLLFLVTHSQTGEPVPSPSPPTENQAIAVNASNISSPVGEATVVPEELIHYGDVVEIDVVGSFENDWQGRINPEGFLAELAFAAEPILALCQSEETVAQKIAAAYGKYLRSPQVIVRIVDRSARPVTMFLGAVKNQQRFLLKRAAKLNELVFLAGGITDNAGGEIQIFRPEKLSCLPEAGSSYIIKVKIADLIAGKPEANPLIRTGDIVTILEAAPIYVTGGVNYPQKIFARQEMTVSHALAAAGNTVKGANIKNIIIYRRENGVTSTIEVDLSKIIAKQAEDTVLRAFDVVDVPRAGSEPKKQPPIIAGADGPQKNGADLPLVIVD
ncbi:MAG TPA: SLBB domain-containing protein [Pyrinomonadaceae bacterium]|nr:SLBB domain-containing protein [Pyrinomonadaceae bacterium]